MQILLLIGIVTRRNETKYLNDRRLVNETRKQTIQFKTFITDFSNYDRFKS